MKHLTFDNENVIMEFFRDPENKVLAFPQGEELLKTFISINDEKQWSEWIDSSSKDAPPPDYYNEKMKLMMDVMRFDDQQSIDCKKHPTKSRESKLRKEIEESGWMDILPNVKHVFINGVSDLPQNEDHNFTRYRGNFTRVIENHSSKINNYKKNHPGYKLIFFVFDESSSIYADSNHNPKSSFMIQGKPHICFLDRQMVDVIKNCGADYLVWFKPYNSFVTIKGINDGLPKIVMYDIKKMEVDTIDYTNKKMIS